MRLGYPCINRSVGCTANSGFRLASYSEERLIDTVRKNLDCLDRILQVNVAEGFHFFRMSSDLVPFASHPICQVDWRERFQSRFQELGDYARKHHMRLSMHPDQFVLLNAKESRIVESSLLELAYHVDVLEAMGLDATAKIQIHLGGVYGDKRQSMDRFVRTYQDLPARIRHRLVIENDERLYDLKDCLMVHDETGVPVLLDVFHHQCLNRGESVRQALRMAGETWQKKEGPLIVDFSHQEPGKRMGTHAQTLSPAQFRVFLKQAEGMDFDIMLEIKDKEKSARKALKIVKSWSHGEG